MMAIIRVRVVDRGEYFTAATTRTVDTKVSMHACMHIGIHVCICVHVPCVVLRRMSLTATTKKSVDRK